MNLAVGSFTLVSGQPTTTPPTTTPPTTTTPPPTKTTELSITSSGNTIGSLIGIGGAGFTPGGTATITFDGNLIATAEIDEAGLLMVTFEAPPASGGDHIIAVTDGINTDQITFTMESTSISNPVIQTPKTGEKVKKPITFDWDDVISTTPVTYSLQVSPDSIFSTDSILVEKDGLGVSTYQLNEEEELEFIGRDEPYYWRVKAIDATLNESAWSGPFEFYVSPPFSFPTWATITLAIVGGILLFGLGYWLGRRTAFFY